MTRARLVTSLVAVLFLTASGGAIDGSSPGSPADPVSVARTLAAGAAHSLAIDPGGVVWAWGINVTGLLAQLGAGVILGPIVVLIVVALVWRPIAPQ